MKCLGYGLEPARVMGVEARLCCFFARLQGVNSRFTVSSYDIEYTALVWENAIRPGYEDIVQPGERKLKACYAVDDCSMSSRSCWFC